jgi:serine/threonine-protein kinase RsbW
MHSKSIELKSEIHELNQVVAFIEQICDENNIYNHYFGNILTAVSEAFQNAIEHGNKFDINKTVTLQYAATAKGFQFSISDQGNGFNYSIVKDPTDFLTNDGTQGRGLFTIHSLSDQVYFTNNGSTLNIEFYIASINKELSNKRLEIYKTFINQGVSIKSIL